MHNYRQKKLKFPWAAFYKTIFCHIDKSNVHWSTIKSHEIIYVISYFYLILSISNNFNNYKIFYWHYVETVDEKLALIN